MSSSFSVKFLMKALLIFGTMIATSCSAMKQLAMEDGLQGAQGSDFKKKNGDQPLNILFIVVDDLGFDDLGYKSRVIETTTIDSMIQCNDGIVLNQYYVHPVCTPSRAAFLSGKFSIHSGATDVIDPAIPTGMDLKLKTMGNVFQDSGKYETHFVGKWHVGFYKWPYTPTFRGFDSFMGYYGGSEGYWSHRNGAAFDLRYDSKPFCGQNCSKLLTNAVGTYSTHLFTRRAIDVINKHSQSGTGKGLFMYLGYQAVHSPPEAPQYYIDMYKDRIPDMKRRIFAAMLTVCDEGIHNVTQALIENGMLDNTLIVFTTDNGGPTINVGAPVGSRNWPLRGGKHTVWEGGVRGEGFIFRAKENKFDRQCIKKDNRQSIRYYDKLMHAVDWLPTLSSFVNITVDLEIDGVSHYENLNSLLRNSRAADSNATLTTPREGISALGNVTREKSYGFAMRWQDLKLIYHYGGLPNGFCNSTAGAPICKNDTRISTSCPDDYCLYNVSLAHAHQDIFGLELDELSHKLPHLKRQLKHDMTHALIDYRDRVIDTHPDCVLAKFGDDPIVGKFWQPWCT